MGFVPSTEYPERNHYAIFVIFENHPPCYVIFFPASNTFMTVPLLLALQGDMLQVWVPTGRASSSRDSQSADAEQDTDHVRAESLAGLLLFLLRVLWDDVLMAHSEKRIHKVLGRAAALCNPMLFSGAKGTRMLGCGTRTADGRCLFVTNNMVTA